MLEFRIPLPGDVLFFEAGKKETIGKGISLTQMSKGLEYHKYVHAALVINSDLIVESDTDTGVRRVQLSSHQKRADYLKAIVLRKPSHSYVFDQEQLTSIIQAAYYFYKEAYDWRGIINRSRLLEGASICSVFVKKALLQSKQLDGEWFSSFPEQIYPAELYSALLKAGYCPLDGGYDFNEWEAHNLQAVDIIEVLENARALNDSLDQLNTTLAKMNTSAQADLDRDVFTESSELINIVFLTEGLSKSLLELLHENFEDLLQHHQTLEKMINGKPNNWRDRGRYHDALMLEIEMATARYLSTMNFTRVFISLLVGSSRKPAASLKDADQLTELFHSLLTKMGDIFLVTRTTDMDHAKFFLREATDKLTAYSDAVARLTTLRGLDLFPASIDSYGRSIQVLEVLVAMFDKLGLSENTMSQIAAEAKNGVQQLWTNMSQLRGKMERRSGE
jgi:uncharacterized protein YycO